MKYNRLPVEELEKLEKEFVDFLVVNGIIAEEWEKIKGFDKQKADAIIDQFSDVIWEGVLRKAKYLEKKEEDTVYLFKCDEDQIHLKKVTDNELLTASKPYNFKREDEIFDMVQQGCEISDGTLYDSFT
jgi:hypothetical protein